MMHHHTKFGCKRLRGSENISWANPGKWTWAIPIHPVIMVHNTTMQLKQCTCPPGNRSSVTPLLSINITTVMQLYLTSVAYLFSEHQMLWMQHQQCEWVLTSIWVTVKWVIDYDQVHSVTWCLRVNHPIQSLLPAKQQATTVVFSVPFDQSFEQSKEQVSPQCDSKEMPIIVYHGHPKHLHVAR